MNLYEHTIIARQDASPSEIKQLTEKYSKIVKKNNGEVIKTENWGLLNLSYFFHFPYQKFLIRPFLLVFSGLLFLYPLLSL